MNAKIRTDFSNEKSGMSLLKIFNIQPKNSLMTYIETERNRINMEKMNLPLF